MFEKFTQRFRKEESTPEKEVVYFDSQIDHAPDRNFDIEMEEKEDGEITLKLRRNDGDVYDLDDVLPDGDFKFIQSKDSEGRFIFHHDKNGSAEIQIQREQLTRRDFLINVFHEIGHSYQYSHTHSVIGDTYKETGNLKRAIEDLSTDDLSEEEEYALQKLEDELQEKTMIIERQAWAWALTELRHLEEQGYDVFSGFGKSKLQEDGTYRREKPRKEIMEYIYDCLGTYEEEVEG